MCLFKNFMSGNIIDFLRLKSIKTTKTFDSSNFTVLIDLPNFYSKFSMKKKTLQQTFIAPSFNLNAWKFLRYKFFAAIFLFNQLLMLIYVWIYQWINKYVLFWFCLICYWCIVINTIIFEIEYFSSLDVNEVLREKI